MSNSLIWFVDELLLEPVRRYIQDPKNQEAVWFNNARRSSSLQEDEGAAEGAAAAKAPEFPDNSLPTAMNWMFATTRSMYDATAHYASYTKNFVRSFASNPDVTEKKVSSAKSYVATVEESLRKYVEHTHEDKVRVTQLKAFFEEVFEITAKEIESVKNIRTTGGVELPPGRYDALLSIISDALSKIIFNDQILRNLEETVRLENFLAKPECTAMQTNSELATMFMQKVLETVLDEVKAKNDSKYTKLYSDNVAAKIRDVGRIAIRDFVRTNDNPLRNSQVLSHAHFQLADQQRRVGGKGHEHSLDGFIKECFDFLERMSVSAYEVNAKLQLADSEQQETVMQKSAAGATASSGSAKAAPKLRR